MEMELFKKIAKYPFIWKEQLFSAKMLSQNKHCLKCDSPSCTVLLKSSQSEHICKLGFNSFSYQLGEGKIIFNGLIADDNDVIKKGRLEARAEYRVARNNMNDYLAELDTISNYFDETIKKNIQEKFTLFHDVRTSYAIAFSNLEAIILSQKGNSFNEKLQNSDPRIIDLYDSLDLVISQLDLIDVMINPAAAVQGRKREINLFKLTHKLVKLFQVKASKKNITIEYRSKDSIPSGFYHDSIGLVPIILIENAIKYSEVDNRIIISFEYSNYRIRFTISTYGLGVPEEEKSLIFDKQRRGSNASEYTSEGLGLGLYIAKIILMNHNGAISYRFESKGRGYGFNYFTFELPV